MSLPTLHLIGVFHTVHSTAYSHCAFTGKALRFAKMMQARGYSVVEYSNDGSESAAQLQVPMLSQAELQAYVGDKQGGEKFFGDTAQIGSPWHVDFENRLIEAMRPRLEKRDIICHPFNSHPRVVSEFPGNVHLETGIGYPKLIDGAFKVFESYAWMHYHQGKENRHGDNYEWVIPNYYDLDEWEPSFERGKYIAFMGRIIPSKGLDVIYEIASRVDIPVKVAGQGDFTPWKHPNIEYVGPLAGRERSDFIRNAYCQLMPTRFVEPFGGAGVEGLLCGTPLIASDYGAFAETIQPGFNGYRCHVLKQWLGAIAAVSALNRENIAKVARARYSLATCGAQYAAALQQIDDLQDEGWYTIPGKPETRITPFRAPMVPIERAFKAGVSSVGPKNG